MSRNHFSETSKLTSTSGSKITPSSIPPAPPPSSTSARKETSGEKSDKKDPKGGSKPLRSRYHFNSIWSIWYCLVTTVFTGYLVYRGLSRFLFYASLPWPDDEPYMELNAHVGLVGAAVVVMPFFIVASVMKIGNLPNDGFKLGSSLSTCSRDPPAVIQPSTGIIRNLWLHGVPTSPFLHLIAAFCLLLPQTLMEATLIKAHLVPAGEIWKSDLDIFYTFGSAKDLLTVTPSALLKNETPTAAGSIQPSKPSDEKFMMVRIEGTGGSSDAESRPFSEIAGPTWRGKRSPEAYRSLLSPSLPDLPPKLPGPFPFPVKTGLEKYSRKNKPLSSFSPHQTRGTPKPGTPPPVHGKGSSDLTQTRQMLLAELKKNLMWNTLSPELINYAFALLFFAIRYPSVFWHTNKKFSFLFSFHLVVTGIQTVITVASFSILYKYQVNVTSRGYHKYSEAFLSTPVSSLLLFLLSILTLTVSSSAVYFYGYQRFATFLDRSRKRFHIMYSSTPLVMRPHTAQLSALAALLCFALSFGPLIWDLSTLYKMSNGHKIILCAIISTILYLCLWVFLWIFLSVKSSWVFKLRVTVARAFVSSARSIKLVNDVEMAQAADEGLLSPILVIGNGRAVAIKDSAPQKAIMGVVNKIKEEKKLRGQEEEIYWLKPTLNSSFDRGKLGSKTQPKVTFNDTVEEKYSSGEKLKDRPLSHCGDYYDDEAGDYAILKESYPSLHLRDGSETSPSSESEESSQRSPVLEDPRYVDRNQILSYEKEAKSMSSTDSSPVLVAPDYEETDQFDDSFPGPPSRHQLFLDSQGSVTPRSTRSNDSGVPFETPSQRSDSLSSSNSSNSHTPPENSEESGVHSGATDNTKNKCNSDEDLSQLPHDPHQISLNRHRFRANPTPQTTAEATVAIRRQRNLTQEIRPPADPIYGTRKITSFTPSENTSPVPSPVPPMPPLPSLESSGVVGLYPPRHSALYGGYNRQTNQLSENPYGQRANSGQMKCPQKPLPPIPQGMVPPPAMEPLRNTGMYGRTTGSQLGGSNGVYGYTRNIPMGRSSSLRYPSPQGGIPKQYTNTLPHVLPKDSHYNTNV